MQIKEFTRVRNLSIAVTIVCTLVIILCYSMDTSTNNVGAIWDYILYSHEYVNDGELPSELPSSCSLLLRDDSIFKSNPDHKPVVLFDTVDQIEEFVDGWDYDKDHKINPYINAYIKQSLWEYADWCINEESSDYWHMKYVASQKTGGYSYARQIKYKWYKLGYENAPFVVMISVFLLVFVNVLCILYGLKGTMGKGTPVKKMPRWHNDCADREE